MDDDIVKKKFDERLEKLKRKHWLLITGGLAVFFVLSLIANIVQLIDSDSFTGVLNKLKGLGTIPIVAALPAVILLAAIFWTCWYKERTLRKHLEKEKEEYLTRINQNFHDVKQELKEELREISLSDQLRTKGEFYILLQHLLVTHRESSIYIVDLHREWIYKFVFSLFISTCQKNRVIVLSQKRTEDEKRNRLLTSLGCELIFIDEKSLKGKFKGVIVDPDKKASCQAICLLDYADPIYATHYYGEPYFPAIKHFFREVEGLLKTSNWIPKQSGELFSPQLCQETEQSILEGMQKITFYRNAEFEFREVRVEEVIPVSSFVETFKFHQAHEIIETYKRKGVPKFQPMSIQFANDRTSPILPPILEERHERLYIAEGHSRLYSLWKQEPKTKVRVLVVKGVDQGFTTTPTEWDKVVLTPNKIPLGENGHLLARNIEGQFRD